MINLDSSNFFEPDLQAGKPLVKQRLSNADTVLKPVFVLPVARGIRQTKIITRHTSQHNLWNTLGYLVPMNGRGSLIDVQEAL